MKYIPGDGEKYFLAFCIIATWLSIIAHGPSALEKGASSCASIPIRQTIDFFAGTNIVKADQTTYRPRSLLFHQVEHTRRKVSLLYFPDVVCASFLTVQVARWAANTAPLTISEFSLSDYATSMATHSSAYSLLHMTFRMLQQGYTELLSIPRENKQLLDLLSQGRRHLASLHGQNSYAEYVLDASCLAGKPAAVTGFLHELNTALQPQVVCKGGLHTAKCAHCTKSIMCHQFSFDLKEPLLGRIESRT